ncbi:uncharacterized protein LOC117333966 [Pecten maximus]|uniref:uncharacterized protein LOC117333966 n=1 Tax=Pecten maximus TaxID=6579 RepID=UPI00145833AE|nr:uncharacterized protein LOC117333966 [Pecten maximus]
MGVRQGVRNGLRKGVKKGIRKGVRKGGKEGGKEGDKEGVWKGGKEGGKEGDKEGECHTKPSPVAFHALMTDSIFPVGAKQIIQYDDVITNVGNAYDKYTGIFQAPIGGAYEFIATMWSREGYHMDYEMLHNGNDGCFVSNLRYIDMMNLAAAGSFGNSDSAELNRAFYWKYWGFHGNDFEMEEFSKGTNRSSLTTWTYVQRLHRPVLLLQRAAKRCLLFHARLQNAIYPIGTNQIIAYEDVVTNVGNGYDSFTGLFRAPVGGAYEFIATMWSSDGNFLEFEMVRNSVYFCYGRASQSNQTIGSCVSMVELSAGDRVWGRHLSGRSTYANGQEYPSFAGHLIV